MLVRCKCARNDNLDCDAGAIENGVTCLTDMILPNGSRQMANTSPTPCRKHVTMINCHWPCPRRLSARSN